MKGRLYYLISFLFLWLGGVCVGIAIDRLFFKTIEEYTFGSEYNISVLEGFEDIELTIPRNQCGPTIIIQNWTQEGDCEDYSPRQWRVKP